MQVADLGNIAAMAARENVLQDPQHLRIAIIPCCNLRLLHDTGRWVPEESCGSLGKLFFVFVSSLVELGFRKTLVQEDLWDTAQCAHRPFVHTSLNRWSEPEMIAGASPCQCGCLDQNN